MRSNPLAVCAVALVLLTAAGLALPRDVQGQFGIGYGAALDAFVALAVVEGAVYAAAVWFWRRQAGVSLGFILGVAALLRLMVLFAPPFLSNDLYRYIWDGWVQARGINPYRYVPADPHLAFLRDAVVYPNINRATYAHTIYPPGAEMVFFLITRVGAALSLPPVLAMKAGMVALEAVGIAAMLRMLDKAGLPRGNILIYAWNPLPIWEFAGNGHVDAIAVCFVALALLWAGRSAVALALAVLTKFLPVVLVPALWRRGDWRSAAIFCAVVVGCYVPYLSVGTGVFGVLGGYAAQEHLSSGQGVFLADALGLSAALYFVLFALVLAGIAVFMLLRPAGDVAARCGVLIGVLMLGLSPHYPWYYAWALVPAVVTGSWALMYLSCASFLLYLNPGHTALFWPGCVLVPFVGLGAWEMKEVSGSFLKKRTKKLLLWAAGRFQLHGLN